MKGFLNIVVITFLLCCLQGVAYSAEPEEGPIREILLTIAFEPPAPEPIQDSLYSVISATLQDVLIDQQPGGVSTLRRHKEQVSLALKEGLNVVLEPKGFSVRVIDLDIAYSTTAEIEIVPAGGAQSEPGPVVTALVIELSLDEIHEIWRPVFIHNLEAVRDDAESYYSKYILGLPLAVSDKSFIFNAINPHINNTEPLKDAFPYYSIRNDLDIAGTSLLTVSLSDPENPIRRLRVRMAGDTIPNFVLDRLREAITSESDVVVGMPRDLAQANLDMIGEYFASLVESEEAAEFFDAEAKVRFRYDDEDDSLIAICEVRSGIYDLNLRGYIDFGLEDADSSEVEGRFGYFVNRHFELMFVLNLFTNDMTLEPDVLLGWRPKEGTFIAGGYDLEAKGRKFFFSQNLGENFFCEGEIFAEDDRNQFGILYRFHQYFSGGLYATGDGDYWFRATFRL